MSIATVLNLRSRIDELVAELERAEKGTLNVITIKTGRKTTELALTIVTILGQVAGFEAGQLPATWTIAGVSVVTALYGIGRVALKIAAVLATATATGATPTAAKPASTSPAPMPASAAS